MIGPADKKPSIRIAGYLEKRGKMMLVSRWKRWWFVLEGRLLLYYKSQLEYFNLSPCRGSLNLGLASSVRPGKGLELTIITRSQTVMLRASNRVDHEQWLQSLVDAMALPHTIHTFNARPVMHFRYASQEYHENIIKRIKSFKCPSYSAMSNDNGTTPTQTSSCKTSTSSSHSSGIGQSQPGGCMLRRVLSDSRTLLQRPCRRSSVRSSTRLSKTAFSDTSIPVTAQTSCLSRAQSSDKCQSLQELCSNGCASVEDLEESKCKYESIKKSVESDAVVLNESKDSKLSNSIKIELNLENVDCKNGALVTEQKIGNVKIVLDGCAIYGSTELNDEVHSSKSSCKMNGKVAIDCDEYVDRKKLNLQLYSGKEAKSDTDLAIKRKIRGQSLSCENVQTLDRSIGSTYNDTSAKMEVIAREQRGSNLGPTQNNSGLKSNKKRSNSILSRFLDSKAEPEVGSLERRGTLKKKLSFLRKVWKKREKKAEDEDYDSIDYESIPVVIELPSPEVEKAEELLLSLEKQGDCGPEPEPPPDYDISLPEESEVPPMLPPRHNARAVSPWHDVPQNNQPVSPAEEDQEPPPLPVKTKHKHPHQLLIQVNQDPNSVEQTHSSLGGDSVMCEPPSRNGEQKLDDLDTLLAQLSEVNTYVVRQIDVSQSCNGNFVQVSAAVESDYDVPRPHISLLATLRRQNIHSDTFTPTHFLCSTPLVDMDSLDPVINRLDADMTPDSLECDSWSLTHSDLLHSRPTLHSDSSHSSSLQRHFISTEDKLFPDSLNS